jgi:hypothetical protein
MDSLMTLVVGWTLVGAFVFTVVITCLSLVGWMKFADKKQQSKLFQVLVVELVLGGAAKALGLANFNPVEVGSDLKRQGANAAITETLNTALAGTTDDKGLDRDTAQALVERIDAGGDSSVAAAKAELADRIRAMPPGRIAPAGAQSIRASPALDGVRADRFRRVPDR